MGNITMIAAMDENRVIGKDNKLPWRHTEDLKFFKEQITGAIVVMGKNTYDSLKLYFPDDDGHPKAGTNVILSRTFTKEGVTTYTSVEEILEAFKNEKIFITGGTKTYEAFLPYTDRLLLTRIPGTHEGDSFFPSFEELFKKVTSRTGTDGETVFETWEKKED